MYTIENLIDCIIKDKILILNIRRNVINIEMKKNNYNTCLILL